MRRIHHLRPVADFSVRDDEHLEHLLNEAERALESGRRDVAITHLCQAVYVASTKQTRLSDVFLQLRVKRIIDEHGGVA